VITLPAATVIGFVLALVRASAWVVVCPPFSNRAIPAVAKIGLAACLALVAAPAAGRHLPATLGTAGFVTAVVEQAVTGLAMGFLIQVVFSAFSSAGSLIDIFSGLNLPPSIDPLSLDQAPLISQLYELVAFTLLFTSGADLLLVRGFLGSFAATGVDASSPARLAASAVGQVSTLFSASLEMAAPLVAVLFVTQLLLGLLAKAAPQMNVFVFGFGLQVLVTLLGLTAIGGLPQDLTHLLGRVATQVFG
jgi:flagellar biosynthetic protein FliR